MSCKGDTGHGATLLLSVSGAIGRIRTMQLPTWAMESIDMTALDSVDWMCSTPADVADPGELTAEVIFDTEVEIPGLGTIEDATVSFPIMTSTNTGAATFTGSGFLSQNQLPNIESNALMTLNITFKYDGNGTVPTFTAEAAS